MLSTQRQGRLNTNLQELLVWHTYHVVQLPRWRHPLIGYVLSALLVGLGFFLGLIEARLLLPMTFPGVLLTLTVLIVALLCGAGPAVLALLSGLLVLDYLYVPPFGVLGVYEVSGALQLLTFTLAGIVTALLVSQLESARLRAVVAEGQAITRANQLEATFEAMTDGVVVYNHQGHVLQTNAAIDHLFGLACLPSTDKARSRQELLLRAAERDERGAWLPAERRPLSRLFKGKALSGANAVDVLVHTPDGREVLLNTSGAPIRDEKGNIERAVLIFRDVTERRRLEQHTADSLSALLAIAEALAQNRVGYDHQGQEAPNALAGLQSVGQRLAELTHSVVRCRHVDILAVEPERDTVRSIASVGFAPEQEQQWRESLANTPYLGDHLGDLALLSGLKNDEVLVLDGMLLPLHAHVLPYYVRAVLVVPICVGKQLIGILSFDDGSRKHDYTPHEIAQTQIIAKLTALVLERVRLQQEWAEARANELAMREAKRGMEESLSLICHELLTPLTVIKGSIQLSEQKVKRFVHSAETPTGAARQLAPIQALLEHAKSQVSFQDRLIHDLLDVSRIQANTLQISMQLCNLAWILQEAIEDQRQAAPSRAIRLELPAEGPVPVQADSCRIAQVVTNYLTNALKYSAPDRPVEVHLQVEGRIARVTVRDQGPGLAPAEQERIWERFYRVRGIEVQSESEASSGGLGIGLYLCRTIIEQHHGQVGVQSSPSKGSNFWFTLPLTRQEETEEEAVLG
jgi:K+-sensing histidine kinase KdpD